MAVAGDYFAHHYRNRNRYYFFFLLTQGATVGVFLSADLFTTFIFFEIMSFTSYTWVAHDETPGAMRAAETYLAVAIIGGMVMLMGLFLLWNAVGTLTISELYEAAKACPRKGTIWAASICILFGCVRCRTACYGDDAGGALHRSCPNQRNGDPDYHLNPDPGCRGQRRRSRTRCALL